MDTRHLVDREIAPLIDLFPRVDLDSAPITQIRAKAAETYSILPPPVIAPERLVVPSIHGGPDIPVIFYRPAETRPGGGASIPRWYWSRHVSPVKRFTSMTSSAGPALVNERNSVFPASGTSNGPR